MDWFEERLHANWRQAIRVKELLFREQTGLQDLVIFESFDWGRVLALDGVVQTTTGDEFCYHEMIVHVPMLAHGAAREVLIIGGGDGGCLREALKHASVERVTQVEIDIGVIELSRRWLPIAQRRRVRPSQGARGDCRRRQVRRRVRPALRRGDRRFDRPAGAGAVLFTEPFYRDVRRLLNPGGIMATQCGNPSIRPEELEMTQAAQRSAGFALVDYYLPVVPTYIGGAMALGFATDAPAARQLSAAELRRRAVPAGLRYYTPDVHPAAFAHPAWMIERIGY